MFFFARRWTLSVVGVAALLASLPQSAFGQAASPNVYVNPGAAGRFSNTGGLGNGVGAPGGALGYGGVGAGGGVGSLSASYANPSLGYGPVTNSAGAGYGYGAGYGMYGTQWMMNPYQGYLSGAADITRANSEYYYNIQQAKLLREEARRSALQTRRAMLEEMEWERAHMPDPEKIRQHALARELDRARVHPPITDITSARSLNALLRHLVAQQNQGVTGPPVPISEDTLDHINLTVGNTRGNVGLLKQGGKMDWPLPLRGELFGKSRDDLNDLMKEAYRNVKNGQRPSSATINDMKANLEAMQERLNANVSQFGFDEYTEANRYLRYVKDTITALKDPNVVNFFNKTWTANARDVAQLVKFMRDKGLWFAPATDRDAPAYRALYNALAAFDARTQRVVSTGGPSE